MKDKKKIVIGLTLSILVFLLAIFSITKIKTLISRSLNKRINFTSEEVYQILSDSPYEVTNLDDTSSANCLYKVGEDYINFRMNYGDQKFRICIVTTKSWQEALYLANSWNEHGEQTNWAFDLYRVSYGKVLIEIVPVNWKFIEEIDELIIGEFKH